MPTMTDMLRKRDWAKERMEKAVEKGDIGDAQKFQEISGAYDSAAERILRERR